MERLRRHWDIVLILLLFVTLGLAYSVVNPLHEATDELRHYRFVRYIVANQALPVQGEEPCRSQSHHPPLIYVLGAAATGWIETGRDVCASPVANPFWAYRYADVGVDNKNMYLHGPEEAFPWHGEALAAHIIRALNVLVGAGTVWLTWATGRTIWPERRSLAAGGAALVAFNPMFLFMSGAINNDVIAALSGAAVLWACACLLRRPGGLDWRWGVVLGAVYGLALMSKLNMAAFALLIGATASYIAWQKGQWRLWWQVGLVTVGVALFIAGWWFVRNQLLYGEPTGFRILTELWGARNPADSWGIAISELPYAWSSLWGRFGFGQIPLPDSIYLLLRVVVLGGLLGVTLPFLYRQYDTPPVFLFLLLLDVLLAFAVLFNYMLVSPAGAMGRFFFPGLPALSLLAFYGLSRWLDLLLSLSKKQHLAARGRVGLALTVNGGMMLLSLVALFGYLGPAYARPPAFTAGETVPNPVEANFEQLATLLGYELSSRSLQPGEPLDIDLYWEVNNPLPGDYLLFVHLTDEAGTLIAQRDTHPGTGTFPTSQWRPGDRFVDSVRIYVPETAYTPVTATLSIGLYAPDYRLGIRGPEGEAWGDTLRLDSVRLLPAVDLYPTAAGYPNPLNQNFNNEIRLLGYEYNDRVFTPGSSVEVTLYWQALEKAREGALPDYLVQVHLVDEAGRVVASADGRPQEGASYTSSWRAGEVFLDTHYLPVDEQLPAGRYQVEIALLDVNREQRQNIVAEDGHWINDYLRLAEIRVQPPE